MVDMGLIPPNPHVAIVTPADGLFAPAGATPFTLGSGPAPPVLPGLPGALGSLYTKMSHTADTVAPIAFLNLLREVRDMSSWRADCILTLLADQPSIR